MDTINEGDCTDASRPYFNRQTGEIGVYFVIYDAKPEDPTAFGLEHFFFMQLLEKLYERLTTIDIVNLRMSLDRKGVLHGVYLERFEKGLVLALGFDNEKSLDEIEKLHKTGKLNILMQEVLINQPTLKAVSASRITLRTRLWNDELTACRDELKRREHGKENIYTNDKDTKLLERLKSFQQEFNEECQVLSEMENEVEHTLGDFVQTMKRILPHNVQVLKTWKEFETAVKVAKGTHCKDLTNVDHFIRTVVKLRATFQSIEPSVSSVLSQIHTLYENDKQRELKQKIIKLCSQTQATLRSDTELQKVSHPEWKAKLLPREQKLFGGLISLVALGRDNALDINYMLDEYINYFPLRK
ncbi:hypothetical protein ScPMuIL_008443 [Solemya velum]